MFSPLNKFSSLACCISKKWWSMERLRVLPKRLGRVIRMISAPSLMMSSMKEVLSAKK